MTSLPPLHVEHRRPANPALRVLAQPARHVEGLDEQTKQAGEHLFHRQGRYSNMATQFHGRETFVSASLLLEVVSQQLSLMKDELKLTDEQLGRILGRSPDRAAEYRKGHAEIGLLAHSRAAQLWGEDYLNPWLAELGFKAVPLTAKCENDRAIPTRLCAATLVLQEAIEDDGELGPDNLRDARLRAAVERAGTTIDALRERFRASEATA